MGPTIAFLTFLTDIWISQVEGMQAGGPPALGPQVLLGTSEWTLPLIYAAMLTVLSPG